MGTQGGCADSGAVRLDAGLYTLQKIASSIAGLMRNPHVRMTSRRALATGHSHSQSTNQALHGL